MTPLHRAYRGQLIYRTNGVGEMGREFFAVTVQPDGTRTLRAQCEMDDDRLLRDVVVTVDAAWRPLDAYLRLAIDGRTTGMGWFRFERDFAEAVGWNEARGRFAERIPLSGAQPFYGTHALHCDAWTVGRLRAHRGPEPFAFVTHASSTLANGGSGPELIPVPPDFATVIDLGEEAVGDIVTRHIRIEAHGVDRFDVWAAGEDCVPVRLTSDGLDQTYELVALEGDWR